LQVRGTCHCVFAYDIGFSIDLTAAESRITSFTERETIRHKRRAPRYFEYDPAPLRIVQTAEPIHFIQNAKASAQIELVLYDFGALTVIYHVDLTGDLSHLLDLSEELYENQLLLADSRSRVEELLKTIHPAVSKPSISRFVEDYIVFQIGSFSEPISIEQLLIEHALEIAQILRAETRKLSNDEVYDALSHRISFTTSDVAIVDWNAALLVDEDAEDLLTILEFANVELLEMRVLDERLDDALSHAYDRLTKRTSRWFPFRSDPADLREISRWQVDSAILFEGVNNVLKLLGDQYLARLYRLTGERFHLSDWDASILRKLDTLQSIYQKISDQIASRRMEVLEWIIIALIAISIVLPFVVSTIH
jgi:hypothetical protein